MTDLLTSLCIDATPGPADYNTAIEATPGINMSQVVKMDKKKELPRKFTVEPQKQYTYEILSTILAERIRQKIEEAPGPADYDVKSVATVKPCGPKYSLSKRLNERSRKFITTFL
jgi:hypothetical protein